MLGRNIVGFLVALALACTLQVTAQDFSPCAQQCAIQALSEAGCEALTDVACICAGNTFRGLASDCISTNCPGELAADTAAFNAVCAAATSSTTTTSDSTSSASTSDTESTTTTEVTSGADNSTTTISTSTGTSIPNTSITLVSISTTAKTTTPPPSGSVSGSSSASKSTASSSASTQPTGAAVINAPAAFVELMAAMVALAML